MKINKTIKVFAIFILLVSMVSAYGQQYDQPIGPEQQTIGIATQFGCLNTMFSDRELVLNKIFLEKVVGVRVAYLCYLDA